MSNRPKHQEDQFHEAAFRQNVLTVVVLEIIRAGTVASPTPHLPQVILVGSDMFNLFLHSLAHFRHLGESLGQKTGTLTGCPMPTSIRQRNADRDFPENTSSKCMSGGPEIGTVITVIIRRKNCNASLLKIFILRTPHIRKHMQADAS